jgi:RecJ-like exonuclease
VVLTGDLRHSSPRGVCSGVEELAMRRSTVCRGVSVALVMVFFVVAHADTVVLNNGKTVEGEVLSEKDDEVVVKTEVGSLTFKKDAIKEIKRKDPNAEKKTPPVDMTTRQQRAALTGVSKLYDIDEKQVNCPKCEGTGYCIWLPCLRCKGSPKPGWTQMQSDKHWEICERCNGKTKFPCVGCDLCNKTGKVYLSHLSPADGGTKKPPINMTWCTVCNSTGFDVWEECNQCKRSQWKGYLYHGETMSICNRCDGKGRIPIHRCAVCNGKGLVAIGGDKETQFVQPARGDTKTK